MWGWGSIGRLTRTVRRGREKPYKPKLARGGEAPSEPVPEHLRGIRLRRRRRVPRMQPTPLIIRLAVLAAIIGFVLVVWAVFKGPVWF